MRPGAGKRETGNETGARNDARESAILALVLLAACISMRKVKDPTNYITTVRPKLVRITRKDSTQLSMIGAQFNGDTVFGFVDNPHGVMH